LRNENFISFFLRLLHRYVLQDVNEEVYAPRCSLFFDNNDTDLWFDNS